MPIFLKGIAYRALALCFCLLLAACSAPLPTVVQPARAPTLTASAAPTLTDTPLPTATPTPPPAATPTDTPIPPSPTPPPDLTTRYRLDITYDAKLKHAVVNETIHYANRSGETLTELKLMVPATAYAGAFSFDSARWGDGKPVSGTSWRESIWTLPLGAPLKTGETVELQIAYRLALPDTSALGGSRPVPFGYTKNQANLVDWYPFVAPYKPGDGWLAHPNSYYGESLVYEMSDYDISLQIKGGEPGTLVAASAPAVMDGAVYRYHFEQARSFALSISAKYKTEIRHVGTVEITSYYFGEHAPAGKAAPQIAADALALYQELFSPYSHTTLAVVEADFLDGMEYDGLIFISRGMYNLYSGKPADYLTAIVAHETAHQWWYGLVGNDQALEPWLDEALSTYCELLYFEKYAPDAASWWWDVRVNFYNPRGWVNSSVYDQQGHDDSYRQYRDAVYLNGAVFITNLRKTVGDEVFFAFLKDYAKTYGGKIATAQDFFALLKKHTNADLSALMKQYFK